MDFNTLLSIGVSSVATLVVAFLGHTAASSALQKAITTLVTDVKSGVSLTSIPKDVADVQEVVKDAKAVIAEGK